MNDRDSEICDRLKRLEGEVTRIRKRQERAGAIGVWRWIAASLLAVSMLLAGSLWSLRQTSDFVLWGDVDKYAQKSQVNQLDARISRMEQRVMSNLTDIRASLRSLDAKMERYLAGGR